MKRFICLKEIYSRFGLEELGIYILNVKTELKAKELILKEALNDVEGDDSIYKEELKSCKGDINKLWKAFEQNMEEEFYYIKEIKLDDKNEKTYYSIYES